MRLSVCVCIDIFAISILASGHRTQRERVSPSTSCPHLTMHSRVI